MMTEHFLKASSSNTATLGVGFPYVNLPMGVWVGRNI